MKTRISTKTERKWCKNKIGILALRWNKNLLSSIISLYPSLYCSLCLLSKEFFIPKDFYFTKTHCKKICISLPLHQIFYTQKLGYEIWRENGRIEIPPVKSQFKNLSPRMRDWLDIPDYPIFWQISQKMEGTRTSVINLSSLQSNVSHIFTCKDEQVSSFASGELVRKWKREKGKRRRNSHCVWLKNEKLWV